MQIVYGHSDGHGGFIAGFDSTVSAAAQAQLNAVKSFYESTFVDPIKINIVVNFAPTGLASTTANYVTGVAYSGANGLKQKLIDDRTSADDKLAIDNLLGTDSHTYTPTRAEAKALGLVANANTDTGLDGTITFTNAAGMFDFTHSTAMSATSYDFYAVAAHEVSEVMGRQLFVVSGGEFNTYVEPLELFKTGRPFNGAIAGSFSIDGTTSSGFAFNNLTTGGPPVSPNGDFADWANSVVGDAFRAVGEPGKVETVSSTDLKVLDVIGYDRPATDIVFAIDTTGSMTPYIANVKANAIRIINEAFGPASAPDSIDARIAIVGFKDAAGPDGPGENTAILKFTEQSTFAARKAAAISAINGISVDGGGDIPEGDNSALLFALRDQGLSSTNPLPAGKGPEYALSGNFRLSAQSHKIILFSDAPIKDVNLAGQVTAAANNLAHTTISPGTVSLESEVATMAAAAGMTVVDSSDVIYGSGGAYGVFTFAIPDDGPVSFAGGPVGDTAVPGPSVPVGPGSFTTVTAQVYAIQAGTDPNATATLTSAATHNGGLFFSADSASLSDTILKIIDLPPDSAPTITSNGGGDNATVAVFENTTAVTTVAATDPDAGTTFVYSIVGGADAALFQIGSATGALSFKSAPDFETPADSDHNNSYVLQVRASDGTLSDDQLITVNVTDGATSATPHWMASVDVGPHPAGWLPSGIADFNNDGTSDVLWFNSATRDIEVWKLANGKWAGSVDIGSHPAGWQPVGTGDFNHDGTSDVLWYNSATGDAEIWKISNGQWAGSVDIGSHPAGWQPVGVGDFNDDGTSDVLWFNAASGHAETWKISNGQWAGSTDLGSHPAGWQPAGVGDFNHDGITDILWRQTSTGHIEDWLLASG